MMATTVGQETDIKALVKDLIALEHDAIAAYDVTIDKLDDGALGEQVERFRADHHQHLQVLTEMAAELGLDTKQGPDIKAWLTTGKVRLADLMGDGAILKAVKTNEDDTVAAYERAIRDGDAVASSKAFFARALADEQRHREWMEKTAAAL